MLNAETSRGKVLFTAEDHEADAGEAGPVEFVPCADETEMLTGFWDAAARHYDSIVTFNGRGFDVPFLYLRSALLECAGHPQELAGLTVLPQEPHCDLAEQLTFYGVSGAKGRRGVSTWISTAKPSASNRPKAMEWTGMDVNDLLAAGKYREIAEYCLRDVRATVLL